LISDFGSGRDLFKSTINHQQSQINGGVVEVRGGSWDVLIVTASNERQAEAYEAQLNLRRELGLLSDVREAIVVADPGGRRIGSGGSTLHCLMEVLRRRLGDRLADSAVSDWQQTLAELRILIVHAGGDSRRLPAYGPCGKIFIPVPGENDSAVCLSLFDRQLPTYLALPEPVQGRGQVVIASGDVLLRFDPTRVKFTREGITGLACYAQPEQASRHGVFCRGQDDEVRLYLQKPSIAEQERMDAIDAYGQSCLDIGVMHFDAATAVRLLQLFGAKPSGGKLVLGGRRGEAVMERGLDFYREICCAMGHQATAEHHVRSARESGSKWTTPMLGELFKALSGISFNVQLLTHCDFLDFGASRGILGSGARLLQEDRGVSQLRTFLDINNEVTGAGSVQGSASWVEGCRIRAPLTLAGDNVVVGVDLDGPVSLPAGACLDVLAGHDPAGRDVWFVRCYGVDDTFKESIEAGAVFCGRRLITWLADVGVEQKDVWDSAIPSSDRTIWNARLFPAVPEHGQYRQWLWMFDPDGASETQRQAWRSAPRYSLEQILALADHKGFYERRSLIRAELICGSLHRVFRPESGLSARELAWLMKLTGRPAAWSAEILKQACRCGDHGSAALVFPRMIHTLGSAMADACSAGGARPSALAKMLDSPTLDRLKSLGLDPNDKTRLAPWSERMQEAAFVGLERAIVASGLEEGASPRSVLRSDEIVWARAPARLDIGGGWTDTPPYSLEWGGCVTNAAINLNDQPPIQAYVRVIEKPVIRIGSIDLGVRIEVSRLEDLMDYRQATGSFALAKAAIVLSGLSPGGGRTGKKSLKTILEAFGGGIELTTLAAIPKGSGLGTSSIMGAVIVAALGRAMGRQLSHRELFHSVLRLEQALTTGGGWQDQIGGVVEGVKMIVTEPGMVPDAHIHYVPSDILDPRTNAGQTLLYYTGITRLAKNILHQVVGRYLNRDRDAMTTLRHIGSVAKDVMDAFIRKDIERFGRLMDVAWRLNKRLDPNSSNEEIEALFARVGPHIYGGKLLGAGGGGFMLMICKSPEDATAVHRMLESDPPNDRARFFDFDVSDEGLVVTVC
jgi:galactokinase/mevalonate kinase-like predicted kinase